jgi:uracil-DNA glycosylase
MVTPCVLTTTHTSVAKALAALAAEAALCQRCPLATTRQQVVWAAGVVGAPLVIVGEAPGATEDATGQPFVGRAGRLLNAMLAEAGFCREHNVYITNLVKCRPPGNRPPTATEVAACQPFLMQQLALQAPRAVVALGRSAVVGLLGDTRPMAALRGHWLALPNNPNVRVMPQYHPSYLLRFAQPTPASQANHPRALAQQDWATVASYLL